MRINQYVAKYANITRAEAEALIDKNLVHVNGVPAQIGMQITPNDQITIPRVRQGNPTQLVAPETGILLYKQPAVSVKRDGEGKPPSLYSSLPRMFHDLEPFPRLPYEYEGLLILANKSQAPWLGKKAGLFSEIALGVARPLSDSDLKELTKNLEKFDASLKEAHFPEHPQHFFDQNLTWYIAVLPTKNLTQLKINDIPLESPINNIIHIKFGGFDLKNYSVTGDNWQYVQVASKG